MILDIIWGKKNNKLSPHASEPSIGTAEVPPAPGRRVLTARCKDQTVHQPVNYVCGNLNIMTT